MIIEEERSAIIDVDESLAGTMLLNAINDYLCYPEGSQINDNSRWWLFIEMPDGENSSDISFHNICEILGINIERIRIIINVCLDKGKNRLRAGELDLLLDSCRKTDDEYD